MNRIPQRMLGILCSFLIIPTAVMTQFISLEEAHTSSERTLKDLAIKSHIAAQILTLLQEALLAKADLTQDDITVDEAVVRAELTRIMHDYGIDEARLRAKIAQEKKLLQISEDEKLAHQLQVEEAYAAHEEFLMKQKEEEENRRRRLEDEENKRREEEKRTRLEAIKADEEYARKLQAEEDRAARSLLEQHRQAAKDKFEEKREAREKEKKLRQEARERRIQRETAQKKRFEEEENRRRREREELIRKADTQRQIKQDEEFARKLQAEETTQAARPAASLVTPPEKPLRPNHLPDSVQYLDIKTPLQPGGIPLHVLGVRPQENNTCGYHTACNLSVIQGLIETRRPIKGNALQDNLLANEIIRVQRMLEDWEVLEVTQDPRVLLNNFMILGAEMGAGFTVTPYPYIPLKPTEELSPDEFNRRLNFQTAYFATIKKSKSIIANLALNLDNVHWVGLSIVKKDGIVTLYYVDSLNRGVSKGSRAYDLITYAVRQII